MIPVRVPVDAPIHTVGGVRTLADTHPGRDESCPVCDWDIGSRPVTLVLVGIDPADRAEGKQWTTGGAVIVHAACAGVTS